MLHFVNSSRKDAPDAWSVTVTVTNPSLSSTSMRVMETTPPRSCSSSCSSTRRRRGGTRRVAYDLLVGADGVNSQVRQQLIARGVMLEPDSREPWFFCEAHRHVDLGWLEDVATQSMAAALESHTTG